MHSTVRERRRLCYVAARRREGRHADPRCVRGPSCTRAEESGAVLVIFTVALVALFVLAALSIDIGNEAQTKQHVANAAENAALSSVVWLAAPYSDGPPPSAQQCPYWSSGQATATTGEECAAYFAEYFAGQNYPSDAALAVGAGGWNTCPKGATAGSIQAAAGTNYTVTTWQGSLGLGAASCIGFFSTPGSSNPNGIVVAIPSKNVQFAFGPVGGVDGHAVSSLAAASLKTPGAGYVLPFGLAFQNAGGGLSCLKFGASGQCPGFADGPGEEGTLNSPRYVLFRGDPPSQGINDVIEANLDLGIDHLLNTYPDTQSEGYVCDAEGSPPNCPAYNATPPYADANSVATSTGQILGDVTPALFTGFSGSFPSGSGSTSYTFSPRFSHPAGFVATTQSQATASPSGSPPSPDLSSVDNFGSTYSLDGVHITKYLIGNTSPTTLDNPLFQSCYDPAGGGSPPNPFTQAIDVGFNPNPITSTGASIWNPQTDSTDPTAPGQGDPCLANTLSGMSTTSAPIFSSSIVGDPRWGEVPVIGPANGRGYAPIESFVDVFLYQAWEQGGQAAEMNAWVFPPNLVQPVDLGGGAGFTGYEGGAYVTNLCSLQAANC